jgi:hypothetical protein
MDKWQAFARPRFDVPVTRIGSPPEDPTIWEVLIFIAAVGGIVGLSTFIMVKLDLHC